MQDPDCYEQYPAGTVFVATLVSLLIYGIGAYLLFQIGIIWALCYILFILILEYRLISGHCADCYYYGRTCAFGKGRLSPVLVKKGDPESFLRMQVTWKDILPDFLTFIIPVIAGILLLTVQFRWTILGLSIALLVLGFAGNAYVRGHLACRFCRQKKIGCPAHQLFEGNKRS